MKDLFGNLPINLNFLFKYKSYRHYDFTSGNKQFCMNKCFKASKGSNLELSLTPLG